MINIAVPLIFTLLSTGITPSARAECSLKPSISLSGDDGGNTFDDADLLGGNGAINKITRVEVYAGNYFFHKVVTKIKTTYKLQNDSTETIEHGRGGDLDGTVIFGEGVYLRSIKMYVGKYLDWIQFCDTNDVCSNLFGGSVDQEDNRHLYHDRSVIKSFLGKDGAVIDRLRVYFEKNRIHSAKMQDPEYSPISHQVIDEKAIPDASQTLDNLNGRVTQSTTLTFEETVKTTESTTITKSHEFDTSLEVSASAGVNFQFASAEITSTFTVGSSWSESLLQYNEKTLTNTIKKEFPLVAPPRTLAKAAIHFSKVNYEFSWEAPTICFYTFSPKTEVRGGSFEGTMSGSQPFQEVTVVVSYVHATDAPISARPTTAPIKEPSTSPNGQPTKEPRAVVSAGPTLQSLPGSEPDPVLSTPIPTPTPTKDPNSSGVLSSATQKRVPVGHVFGATLFCSVILFV